MLRVKNGLFIFACQSGELLISKRAKNLHFSPFLGRNYFVEVVHFCNEVRFRCCKLKRQAVIELMF